jgi:hypothetical protein
VPRGTFACGFAPLAVRESIRRWPCPPLRCAPRGACRLSHEDVAMKRKHRPGGTQEVRAVGAHL